MHRVGDYAFEDEERQLRMDQMRADIRLKSTQAAAEWPKVFTAALLAVAAIFTVLGGLVTKAFLH